jgi:hypothetical protein
LPAFGGAGTLARGGERVSIRSLIDGMEGYETEAW